MLESTNRERVGSRAVTSAFSKIRRVGVSKRENGRTCSYPAFTNLSTLRRLYMGEYLKVY